jgi:hypothetical protein
VVQSLFNERSEPPHSKAIFIIIKKISVMLKLNRNEVLDIALLNIENAALEAFRTRLLIAYSSGMGYIKGSALNAADIKDDRLVTRESDGTWHQPLHPVIVNIFKEHAGQLPPFQPAEFKKLARELAVEMHKHLELTPKEKEEAEGKYALRLYGSFRSVTTTMEHMQSAGLSHKDIMDLTIATPVNELVDQQVLDELFRHPFYSHLVVLALRYNVKSSL